MSDSLVLFITKTTSWVRTCLGYMRIVGISPKASVLGYRYHSLLSWTKFPFYYVVKRVFAHLGCPRQETTSHSSRSKTITVHSPVMDFLSSRRICLPPSFGETSHISIPENPKACTILFASEKTVLRLRSVDSQAASLHAPFNNGSVCVHKYSATPTTDSSYASRSDLKPLPPSALGIYNR